MATRHAKVIIIGSGPAGYTAGIYAARAMLKPSSSRASSPGQMTTTTDVENYPGFADVIQGPWLMDQMQAEHVGTEILRDHILEADLKRRPFGSRAIAAPSTPPIRSSSRRARRRAGSGFPPKSASRVTAYRLAPPATASSSAARR